MFISMRRKLVQQGTTTLMVSLPSKWVKQHNLEKGDEVEIDTVPEGVLISAEASRKETATTLALKGSNPAEIRTLIVNAYRAGYDKLTVTFETDKQYEELLDILHHKLLGFEVVSRKQHSCVIENVTEPSFDHFEMLVTKLLQNISELLKEAIARSKGEQPSPIKDIEERILKYDNFCRRAIAKQPLTYKAALHLSFFSLIIHGNRELYHMLDTLKGPTNKGTQQLLEEVQEVFQALQTTYLRKDIAAASPMHKSEKEILYKTGYELLRNTQGGETIVVHHALAAVRRFYQASSPLTGILQ